MNKRRSDIIWGVSSPFWYFVALLTCNLSAVGLEAQTRSAGEVIARYQSGRFHLEDDHSRNINDTVYFPTFDDECALDWVTIGGCPGWGRVSGMNSFGDLEKAQRLTFEGSAKYRVVGAIFYFERPAIVGGGTINAKAYEINPVTRGPGRLIGFSRSLAVTNVIAPDTAAGQPIALPTYVAFDDGVPVMVDSRQFYLSCDFSNLYATFDTLVLLQTEWECGDGGDSWELWADGFSWVSISSIDSWTANADFAMAAVVEFDVMTSSDDFLAANGLEIFPVLPNPVSGVAIVRFGLERPGALWVDVFDVNGRQVMVRQMGHMPAGRHEALLDLSVLMPGTYICVVRNQAARLATRLVVH